MKGNYVFTYIHRGEVETDTDREENGGSWLGQVSKSISFVHRGNSALEFQQCKQSLM